VHPLGPSDGSAPELHDFHAAVGCGSFEGLSGPAVG
jgi:hypothetical protein